MAPLGGTGLATYAYFNNSTLDTGIYQQPGEQVKSVHLQADFSSDRVIRDLGSFCGTESDNYDVVL